MIELKVKTVTPDANRWLEERSPNRILNLFEGVCNLLNSSGSVLSIVTSQDDRGPFAILIDPNDGGDISGLDFRDHAALSTPILIKDRHLQLGSLHIVTSGGTIWNPYLDWSQLKSSRMTAQLDLIREYLKDAAPSDSLVSPILNGNICAEHHERALYLWATMKRDLVIPNSDEWKEACRDFAGLGPGLTPAGDDFLMGLIYRIWLEKEEKQASSLVSDIVKVAAPMTNTLSRSWLQAASRKQASYPWHRFHRAILDDQSSDILIELNRMLTIGHTSGADALAGFLAFD